MRARWILGLAGMVAVAPLRAQTPTHLIPAVDARSASRHDAVVQWHHRPDDYRDRSKIMPKTAVTMRIQNFNYVRFAPVLSVQTKTLPAYALLENLWGQVLSLNTVVPLGGAAAPLSNDSFLDAFRDWRTALRATRDSLREALNAIPKSVALDQNGIDIVEARRVTQVKMLKLLSERRDSTYSRILLPTFDVPPVSTAHAEAYYAQQLYDSQLEEHKEVASKVEAFIALASDVAKGRLYTFDSHKAGTAVTVSVTVKSVGGDAETIKAAQNERGFVYSYLVESPLPVKFHAGPVFKSIQSFDIEKVQNGTRDVFQQIDNAKEGGDLVAFMTYMVHDAGNRTGFGPTLGTGVADVGKKVYVGLSFAFTDRLYVTGGALSETLKQGETALATDPKLFESLKNVRKWGWFASFSVTPF